MTTSNLIATAKAQLQTSKFISAAFLSLLGAAVGAQAETYQGVQAPVSANSRVEVRVEAVIAARTENAYAEGASSRVVPRLVASTERSAVRAQATATARSANPYAEGYGQGVASVSVGSVDPAALQAQARAAARGEQLPL
ncbi:helicase SNF2 [Variovorax sp. J22P240]|uniref:helicase SNF2 n=1 Tax=Variovorax sp. J22P240 TaxID=3053514 RepID=UPI002578F156|nr:helicase SNF2 [Variovorax sp. J22P240]MDM0001087.1 helicase SNF2 [Variovorax sp. J22P240]